jgi:hypothetical protein
VRATMLSRQLPRRISGCPRGAGVSFGVALGSARLAKRRHLDGYRQKPEASRRDANLC